MQGIGKKEEEKKGKKDGRNVREGGKGERMEGKERKKVEERGGDEGLGSK